MPSNEITSEHHSARSCENTLEGDNEGNIRAINNVDDLKQGIIKTSNTKAKASYTILLVGETGVGKSSVMELIANVLTGNHIDHYDFEILDRTNEHDSLDIHPQTILARLYELTSNNGIVVRILDTPGLADTRDIRQDELQKKSIATQVEQHIDSVTAVLVLANGTVPGLTIATDYALSTLSATFPTTLTNNLAFMLTNVSGPLYQNFSGDTIPDVLKDAPQFLLDNPIALQRKYLKLKDDVKLRNRGAELRNTVKAGEEQALEMLVDFFDWLDGLERQSTTEAVTLCEGFQDIVVTIPGPSAQQMNKPVRKVKEQVQEGVRKIKRMFTGQ